MVVRFRCPGVGIQRHRQLLGHQLADIDRAALERLRLVRLRIDVDLVDRLLVTGEDAAELGLDFRRDGLQGHHAALAEGCAQPPLHLDQATARHRLHPARRLEPVECYEVETLAETVPLRSRRLKRKVEPARRQPLDVVGTRELRFDRQCCHSGPRLFACFVARPRSPQPDARTAWSLSPARAAVAVERRDADGEGQSDRPWRGLPLGTISTGEVARNRIRPWRRSTGCSRSQADCPTR